MTWVFPTRNATITFRWHLSRFAADRRKPRVWRYSKSADAYHLLPARDAAVIGHYYTWRRGDENDYTIERDLAAVDARAAEVLPKLERGRPLTRSEARVLTAYVAVLHGRVPLAREGFQKVLDRIGALTVEMAVANATEEDLDQQLEDARQRGLASTKEELRSLHREIVDRVDRGEMRITPRRLVCGTRLRRP